MINSDYPKLVFRTFQSSLAHKAQESSEVTPRDLQSQGPSRGTRLSRSVSQTRLLTHSDRDVVVPVIFGDQRHHRPVPGGVGGIDGDELFSAVLGEPVHLNGVAHSVGEKEHFNLGEEQTLKDEAGSHGEG